MHAFAGAWGNGGWVKLYIKEITRPAVVHILHELADISKYAAITIIYLSVRVLHIGMIKVTN